MTVTSRIRFLAVLAGSLGLIFLPAAALSQAVANSYRESRRTDAPPPEGKTPRTPDGRPDLSGYWRDDGNAKPHGNLGKDLPGWKLPFTPAGAAAQKFNVEKTVDPESLCLPGGLPREDAGDGGFQLLQAGSDLAFLYQYGTFRVIPLDRREHSEDPDPSYFGEASANWDGDTLVIDSVGFKDKKAWADENANPHSDALHTIERWTRSDRGHLHLDLTVDDPKFYTEPFHYKRSWLLATGRHMREQACSENNVDVTGGHLGFGPGPIRADGTRGYDNPAPLPPPPTKNAPAKTFIPPVKGK